MKPYDIKTGRLCTDLDTPYDSESNKIDVYSSCYWGKGLTKDEYEVKEKLIFEWGKESDLFVAKAWCDISGWDYWNKQEEENYVSIDFYLKKSVEDYTQEEMQVLRDTINEADEYFIDNIYYR